MSNRQELIERLEANRVGLGETTTIFQVDKDYRAAIAELRKSDDLAFTAYCAGYQLAHNDTVEGMYTPPEDYPEEWAEKKAELLNDLLPEPPETKK